jgi:hypothetical protein
MEKKFQFRVSEISLRDSSSVVVSVEDNIITKAVSIASKKCHYWDDCLPKASNMVGRNINEVEKEIKKSILLYQMNGYTPYVIRREVKPKDKCSKYI